MRRIRWCIAVLFFTVTSSNIAWTQVTIEKVLPLQTLEPGNYTLRMKVTDKNRNQTLTQAAAFTVN